MALTDIDAGRLADNVFNNVGPFKNRIINGDMRIDQRNAGASVTPTGDTQYTLDRYQARLTQSSKYSVQRSTTAPEGFTNSLLVTSLSAYSVTSTDRFALGQIIEGYNIADLGWGTANAKAVTVSFWVRSSLTGTFGGSIAGAAADQFYVFSYSISSADTWENKTITVPGATAGTWNTDNTVGLNLRLGLGAGTSTSGAAGSWGATNFWQPTGSVSVVGTNGATFYITGVQLEVGSVATPFEHRSYGDELARCERYYQAVYNHSYYYLSGQATIYANFPHRQKMRITPTSYALIAGSAYSNTLTFSPTPQTENGGILYIGSSGAGYAGGFGTYSATAEL